MPHAEALPVSAPTLTAVLFGLSGCLVDFGARMRLHSADHPVLEQAHATHGALDILHSLQQQGVPCAWLDELPATLSQSLASSLPDWVTPPPTPAPAGPLPMPAGRR